MINVTEYKNDWVLIPDTHNGHGIKTVTGITVIHVPSKLTAYCDIYRSIHKNKQEAVDAIEEKLRRK